MPGRSVAGDVHLARGRGLQPGEDPQHRRLPAAGRSHEHDELPVRDIERDVLERQDRARGPPVVEGLPDATDLDGCGHGRQPRGWPPGTRSPRRGPPGGGCSRGRPRPRRSSWPGVAEVRLLVPDGRLVERAVLGRLREPDLAEHVERQLGVLGDDVPDRRVLPAAVLQLARRLEVGGGEPDGRVGVGLEPVVVERDERQLDAGGMVVGDRRRSGPAPRRAYARGSMLKLASIWPRVERRRRVRRPDDDDLDVVEREPGRSWSAR